MKCNHCGSEWNVSPGLSVSITNCPFCGKSLLPEKKQFNTVEDVLIEINRLFGVSVLSDETKLVAYFSDLAPQLSRQRRILGYFVECGGPKKIVSAMNASDDEQSVCIKQIVREMKDEMYIEEAASQMICESFLYAASGRHTRGISAANATTVSQSQDKPIIRSQRYGLDSTVEVQPQKQMKDFDVSLSDESIASIQDFVVAPIEHSGKKIAQDTKQDIAYREQRRKDLLRAEMTGDGSGNRIDGLVVQHMITQYLASGMSAFYNKIDKAIRAYAGPASHETPLLMEDSTIFGNAKTGFVLTEKKLYWNGGFLLGKRQCNIEDITSVSTYSSDGKLFYIKLKLEQSASKDTSINISWTFDEEEAAQLESFWKDLLLLNGYFENS